MAGGEGGNRIYADEEGRRRRKRRNGGLVSRCAAGLLRTSETPYHAVVGGSLGLPATDRLLRGGIDLPVPLQVEAPLDFAVVDY